MYKRTTGIPSFSKNGVLQLLAASGTTYIMYHMIRIVMLMLEMDMNDFVNNVEHNIGLPQVGMFLPKVWTVLTYGWVHNGFWELFSNMVWLYAFGSIVQMLIGYRQVIPMFLYCMLVGGVFYELAQLIPVETFKGRSVMFGAQAGVIGFAAASLTLSPDYRFHLTEHFSIPLVVIVVIFCVLAIINTNMQPAALFLLAGGAGMGFAYVKLLKVGFRPGGWFYDLFDMLGNSAEPNEFASALKHSKKRKSAMHIKYKPQRGVSKDTIDEILDKINDKGYDSLTKEEKEALFKAGKEESDN